MASDSQVTGSFKYRTDGKIRRVTQGPFAGWLFAGCGRFDNLQKAFAQVEAGEFSPLSSGDEGGGCYLIAKGRKVLCLESEVMVPFPASDPFAIGSGQDFAMGAMYSGKTAVEAVRIAIKLDANSGGPVRSITV